MAYGREYVIIMSLERVDPRDPDPAAIARAAEILRHGGLVVFPTETVYGVGAHALDVAAVARIFAAKRRPSFNPLIVHVADVAAAHRLVTQWPPLAQRAADEFWPGPLTLVLPKAPLVPDAVTAGLPTVAVRVPSHPVALALLRAAAVPIAAPSANRYTELSPTTARHVEKAIGRQVDVILDAGPTSVGIESTVLDLSGSEPAVLRPGSIGAERLEAVLGRLVVREAPPAAEAPRAAPGMVARHYAPRAEVRLFSADERAAVAAEIEQARARGARVAAVVLARAPGPADHEIRMMAEPEAYARRLYAALHEVDDLRCAIVFIERVPATAEWAGVRDRIERAARAP